MIINFHFIFKILKKSILKVIYIYIITYTKCLILQNVDEIFIFKKFQLCGALKNIYVVSNYRFYNHSISISEYEIGLNTILTQLVSNTLSTYFYNTKVQTLHPTSHKLNAGPYWFYISISKYFEFIFLCPYKNCSIF
jgi:hypothetical protein